jgi:hypothetical protein
MNKSVIMGDLIVTGVEAVFWVVFAPIWIPLALLGLVVKFVKDWSDRRRLPG